MMQKKISFIEFRVLNPELIRKMSAIEIKTTDTYDKDGYPLEEGLMDSHLGVINPGLRCKTCGQTMKHCPGHFGAFELVRPVLHAKYAKRVEVILQCTCKECGRILLPDDKIKVLQERRVDVEDLTRMIKLRTLKVRKCPHCSTKVGELKVDRPTNFYMDKERIYPHDLRSWLEKIPNNDLVLFGYNAENVRPEWFVLTVMPVPPITIRPSITLESGIKSEDDLTHKLVDIVRINMRLKENIEAGAPQLIIEDLWDLLQYHVTTYYDNQMAGIPPSKHRSGRPLRSLVQRLKGKKGRFRYNLTGKRVNFAARSTISPDPYLSINQVGVPKEIADELTVQEAVSEWNFDRIKKMLKDTDEILYVIRPDEKRKIISEENKKEITEELAPGYRIERKIIDGDIALFNRQPSLHRASMMAHRVKVTPDKTLKLNPVICKPYNADFDGDEMNLHIPQTEEGKAEALELMFAQNQIFSPRYGAPFIVLDEDGVSGTYILTLDSSEFEKSAAYEFFYELGLEDIPKPDRGNKYSGKLIFSLLLPKDLKMEYKSKTCDIFEKADANYKCQGEKCPYCVKIKNGVLLKGVIDSASLGEGKGKLIDTLARYYPPEVLEQFYYKINRIITKVITRKGVTACLDEYETPEAIKKEIEKVEKEEIREGEKLVEEYKKKTLELIPGRTRKESFEIKMMQLGFKVKDTIEKHLLKEKIKDILKDKPEMNTTIMIVSGSRGSSINLMNISGFWGQAAVREGRPTRGFSGRAISLNKKNDLGPIAGGFIKSNFIDGMDVKEYFFHSMGGRQGEVDTGVSTKVSGYLYRRLANSLKDLSVRNDLTVRSGGGRIIQYLYSEDGVFPMYSFKGQAVDMQRALHLIEESKGVSKDVKGKKK
ncbi:MAG: DNA-directed RNA polymerase subunit A' [Candidatus Diapherotrites archaeon CG08_land_8_20_14_0_20_34_12]|nr:MAG: DNA-directed RNA polymerase subunit A' [Candidatus Diapherotrites archaeon CG08_land_8_20_14_0_20_34_12]